MFNQTFVDQVKTRKQLTIVLSLLLQVAVIGVLILLPLLYTQVLPSAQLKSLLMAPAPPRPHLPKPAAIETRRNTIVRLMPLSVLQAPLWLPRVLPRINEASAVPEIGGGASGGDDLAAVNPLLYGTVPAAPLPPAPVAAKPKAASGPVRVGGVVAEANLLHRVQPDYPGLAKAARIEGSVEFTAVIAKDGHLESLQLVRGHPLLVNAARAAILQWLYRPTLLNGQPVEVVTNITVNFRLNGN